MSLNDDRPEGAEGRSGNGAEEKSGAPSSWDELRKGIKAAGAATENTGRAPVRRTARSTGQRERGEEPAEKPHNTARRPVQSAEKKSEVRRETQPAGRKNAARRVPRNSDAEHRQRENRKAVTGTRPRSSADAQRMRTKRSRRNKNAQKMLIVSAAALVLLILLIILIIFGVRGCMAKRNASKAASEVTAEAAKSGGADTAEASVEEALPTPTPEPTEPPIPPKPDIDINSWEYILANATHSIQDYAPEVAQFEDVMLDYRIIDAMQAFVDGARNQGLSVIMTSGYRDYYTQTSLFEAKVAEYGEEEAATIVAPPGTSEHQTGLAADITDDYYEYMNESLENTELYKWMSAHCHEYGFIVRFPKGKEDITGIMYEPWHYRYVGIEAATYIMENNLTLEEFIELYK